MKQVTLRVADALEQPFPDGQFDLVWSMESGEHMPDKRKVTYSIPLFLKDKAAWLSKKKGSAIR
jgi:ubiquinone/menaquinone biosynthesis C-methylase UbiE